MTVHGILAGPAKDSMRVRVVHHGNVGASRRGGIVMGLNDGRVVRITLDGHTEAARLALDLLGQIPALEGNADMLKAMRAISSWIDSRSEP